MGCVWACNCSTWIRNKTLVGAHEVSCWEVPSNLYLGFMWHGAVRNIKLLACFSRRSRKWKKSDGIVLFWEKRLYTWDILFDWLSSHASVPKRWRIHTYMSSDIVFVITSRWFGIVAVWATTTNNTMTTKYIYVKTLSPQERLQVLGWCHVNHIDNSVARRGNIVGHRWTSEDGSTRHEGVTSSSIALPCRRV